MLHSIKDILLNIDIKGSCSILEFMGISYKHLPTPISVLKNINVIKAKLTKIYCVGSYILQTAIQKPHLTIDIAVEIPLIMFQEKDYTNHRWIYKSNGYLSIVSEEFIKNEFKVKHTYDEGVLILLVGILI